MAVTFVIQLALMLANDCLLYERLRRHAAERVGLRSCAKDARLGPIVDEFNQLAIHYFDLFFGPPADKMAWLEKAEVAVAELYAAALRLPNTEPSDRNAPDMPVEDRSRLMTDAVERIGEDTIYWFVFHPLEPNEEPVASTLVGDLTSIYEDLYEGSALLAAGGTFEDVIWTWRFNFQSHSGRHALGALQALNDMLR